ncbi:MAG: IPT/TIG domain-containing protein [Dehalococcoidia bacterium]
MTLLLVMLAGSLLPTSGARAAGVVTNCTSFAASGGLAGVIGSSGTITFACSGVIALPSQIEVTAANSPLTIDGAGQSVVLTGSGGTRLFRVHDSASLTLRNLTIQDGQASEGGALRADGNYSLQIENVALLNNRATSGGGALALYGGQSTIRGSRLEGNRLLPPGDSVGGAVLSVDSTLTIEASSFISNSANLSGVPNLSGGAVAFRGVSNDATVRNSTFVSNTAPIGGAIAGSTLAADSSIIRLYHLTFSGNSAASIAAGASTVRIANSILNGASPRCSVGTGTVINDLGNWESGGGAGSCGSPAPPSLPTADLALGTLGNYGGPTPTFPIGATSVARVSGGASFCGAPVGSVDQRGVPRPATGCSSGAYQFGAAPTTTSLSPGQVTAGGPPFTLTITGTNFIPGSVIRWNGTDLPTSFVSPTLLTATVPAANIVNGGDVPVTVRYPGPGDADSTPPLPLTVLKKAQTISVLPPGDRTLASSPYLPTANASSGLPVSITSNTPTICTAAGGAVTLLAVGTCTLAFDQPGDAAFAAAPQVPLSFQVTAGTAATATATAQPSATASPQGSATPASGTPTRTATPDLRPGGLTRGIMVPVTFADTSGG